MEVGIDDGKVKAARATSSALLHHAPIQRAAAGGGVPPTCPMPAHDPSRNPRIKEIGQTEVGLMGEIAYDDEYTGPALDPAEGARLAGVIGTSRVVL
jgi:hypothetical protein